MPPPLDVLLQIQRHGGALRELARVLLRDDADADDAVQETWARALGSPPRHQERIGGWLAAILRNVAFRLRRSESRRVRHEQRATARAAVAAEDHCERIARAELAHRLIAAVDALDAPCRDAIWQRFFEGRAPRDIAATSGVPLATVKSRLQRGLAMLRERLTEQHGADWRAAFTAAFGFGREGTAAAAVIAGGVMMATWTKVSLGIAAAAAAVLAIGWWPDPTAAAPVAAAGSSPPSVASAADLGAKTPDPRVDSERTAAAGSMNDPKLAIVRGRCVDEGGRPLAGGRVRVTGSAWNQEKLARWVLDHGEVHPVDVVSEPSRDDGVFALAFSPPLPCQSPSIGVECAGRATVRGAWNPIAPGATIDLGDVVVPHGVLVRGRVVDGSGAPVAGVQIDVLPEPETSRLARVSARLEASTYRADRTDDSGCFDLEVALLPGSYTPRVGDCVVQSPATLELAADRPVEDVVIVVARRDVPRIRGTVVDELDRPVGGVRIGTEHDSIWTTNEGTFELRCVTGDAAKPARVTIGDGDSIRSVVHGDVAWGTRDLVLRVACGVLTVRVVDREGHPVPKALVHVAAAVPAERSQPAGGREPLALGSAVRAMLEHGAAKFDRIERGRYRAIVEFGSNSPLLPLVVPFEFTGGAQQLVLQAGTEATRKLRVQTASGAPVAGTHVQLCEMLGNGFDGDALVREPVAWFWRGGGNVLVLEEGTTDSDGVLPVRGPVDRAMGLRVIGPGHVPVERCDVWFTTDADLVVTVQVGARLRGRVGPAGVMGELRRLAHGDDASAFSGDRQPLVQLFLAENPRRRVPDFHRPEAESHRFRIGEDGTFDLGGLPAGRWRVQLRYWWHSQLGSFASTKDVDVGEVTLRDGETTVLDPDLSRLLPGTLQAQVLRNGAPWAGAQLQLDCERGVHADGRPQVDGVAIRTDADGRFTHVGGAGKYSVRQLAMPGSRRSHGTVVVERGGVSHGTFTFAIGTLALRVLDPAGQPARGVAVVVRPGDARGDTQEDGSVTFELTAGAVTLHTLPRRLEPREGGNEVAVQAAVTDSSEVFTGQLVQIGSATVVEGRTTTLELRLPPEWEK